MPDFRANRVDTSGLQGAIDSSGVNQAQIETARQVAESILRGKEAFGRGIGGGLAAAGQSVAQGIADRGPNQRRKTLEEQSIDRGRLENEALPTDIRQRQQAADAAREALTQNTRFNAENQAAEKERNAYARSQRPGDEESRRIARETAQFHLEQARKEASDPLVEAQKKAGLRALEQKYAADQYHSGTRVKPVRDIVAETTPPGIDLSPRTLTETATNVVLGDKDGFRTLPGHVQQRLVSIVEGLAGQSVPVNYSSQDLIAQTGLDPGSLALGPQAVIEKVRQEAEAQIRQVLDSDPNIVAHRVEQAQDAYEQRQLEGAGQTIAAHVARKTTDAKVKAAAQALGPLHETVVPKFDEAGNVIGPQTMLDDIVSRKDRVTSVDVVRMTQSSGERMPRIFLGRPGNSRNPRLSADDMSRVDLAPADAKVAEHYKDRGVSAANVAIQRLHTGQQILSKLKSLKPDQVADNATKLRILDAQQSIAEIPEDVAAAMVTATMVGDFDVSPETFRGTKDRPNPEAEGAFAKALSGLAGSKELSAVVGHDAVQKAFGANYAASLSDIPIEDDPFNNPIARAAAEGNSYQAMADALNLIRDFPKEQPGWTYAMGRLKAAGLGTNDAEATVRRLFPVLSASYAQLQADDYGGKSFAELSPQAQQQAINEIIDAEIEPLVKDVRATSQPTSRPSDAVSRTEVQKQVSKLIKPDDPSSMTVALPGGVEAHVENGKVMAITVEDRSGRKKTVPGIEHTEALSLNVRAMKSAQEIFTNLKKDPERERALSDTEMSLHVAMGTPTRNALANAILKGDSYAPNTSTYDVFKQAMAGEVTEKAVIDTMRSVQQTARAKGVTIEDAIKALNAAADESPDPTIDALAMFIGDTMSVQRNPVMSEILVDTSPVKQVARDERRTQAAIAATPPSSGEEGWGIKAVKDLQAMKPETYAPERFNDGRYQDSSASLGDALEDQVGYQFRDAPLISHAIGAVRGTGAAAGKLLDIGAAAGKAIGRHMTEGSTFKSKYPNDARHQPGFYESIQRMIATRR